jgi:hypothetical protein
MSTQPTTPTIPVSRYNGWAVIINSATEATKLSDLYKKGRGIGKERIRFMYGSSVLRFDSDTIAFCGCSSFGVFHNKAWYTGLASSFEQGGALLLTLDELKRVLADMPSDSDYAGLDFGLSEIQ